MFENSQKRARAKLNEHIKKALETLPDDQRLALMVHYGLIDGQVKTPQELIALGITPEYIERLEVEAFKAMRRRDLYYRRLLF